MDGLRTAGLRVTHLLQPVHVNHVSCKRYIRVSSGWGGTVKDYKHGPNTRRRGLGLEGGGRGERRRPQSLSPFPHPILVFLHPDL